MSQSPATIPIDLGILIPGDVLLYRPTRFVLGRPSAWLPWVFGRAIALKTWHNISHVEVFAGSKQRWHNLKGQVWGGYASEASRDGLGVDRYPLRLDQLAYVLRPTDPTFNWKKGEGWFEQVKGQKYDWWGLTRFVRTNISTNLERMFCSTFAVRRLRQSGAHPIADTADADSIAPGNLLESPNLCVVASDGLDPPADDGFVRSAVALVATWM